VLREWFRRREDRRRAELDARAPWVREQAFEVVRDLAAPLVETGRARLDWTALNPKDDWLADGKVALVPTNPAAASVEVFPAPSLVTMLVGPRGNSHELVVDDEGWWRRELRVCLEALVNGRYRESASPGRVSRQVVTMTFELPDGDDIVVKHHELFELDPREREPAAQQRFASYA
jgi:hypothetical protein